MSFFATLISRFT